MAAMLFLLRQKHQRKIIKQLSFATGKERAFVHWSG